MSTPRPSVQQIDALLPQTQCGQCGFQGCRPYAQALADGTTAINRCPPGGSDGIARLGRLLGVAPLPLDPSCGREQPRQLASIVEADCIGCTKCIQACPVDAIIGTSKAMHTVISDQCTGCELCLPACPVDCIVLTPMPTEQLDQAHADQARLHYQRHQQRLSALTAERQLELAARKSEVSTAGLSPVQAALARRRQREQGPPST
ncbi:RnfABCDGE type electron transport complex subunit B [Frateuria aurantia]